MTLHTDGYRNGHGHGNEDRDADRDSNDSDRPIRRPRHATDTADGQPRPDADRNAHAIRHSVRNGDHHTVGDRNGNGDANANANANRDGHRDAN